MPRIYIRSGTVADGDLGAFRMRPPSACENVANAELFLDATIAVRGILQRDIGHMRISVFIVMCHIHSWNKLSDHIELTVGLITCVGLWNNHRARAPSQVAKECEQVRHRMPKSWLWFPLHSGDEASQQG